MIASAVVVPEPEDLPQQPSPSLKRRQSSQGSETSKRPRLDTQIAQRSNDATSPTSAMSPPPRKSSAVGTGAVEERKRGQRLFGALLGTLSQTSAKPAHRRRDEIEKRQQDKLRQKDEELEDEKRKKRERLDAVRREEQIVWDKQGVSSCDVVSTGTSSQYCRCDNDTGICRLWRISSRLKLNHPW